jgi:hypothetical protein
MAPYRIVVDSSSGIENAASEIKIDYKIRQRRGRKTAPEHDRVVKALIAEGDQLGKPTHKDCMARVAASEATYYRALDTIRNS